MRFGNRYARPDNFGHPIRNPLLRLHYVYRAYGADGDLLYVGCTMNLEKRLTEHRYGPWRDLMTRLRAEGPYNYETAREIEWLAIESKSERPRFNYTSDHRKLDKIRDRMVTRELNHRMANGASWRDAVGLAVDEVDRLLPSERWARLDDLSVTHARRVEAAHARSRGEAA